SLLIYIFSSTVTSSPTIYSLSLHDALPIFGCFRTVSGATLLSHIGAKTMLIKMKTGGRAAARFYLPSNLSSGAGRRCRSQRGFRDRKSTRLNSSHRTTSYAVFCLNKKKKKI